MVGDHWWTYDWRKDGPPWWLKTMRQALEEAAQLELPFGSWWNEHA